MNIRANLALICLAPAAWGQEAESGFELRTTITAASMYSHRLSQAPRSGQPFVAGLRNMLYPTWKLSRNWTIAGTVQVHSRPYFLEQFSTQGCGVKGDILQAHLSYSRFWNQGSIVVRAGQLSSAFGSFLLRYDDMVNPVIDMPLTYGYYYKGVTSYGLTGAQIEGTYKKLDARAQLVNSSPANRRSILDRDQYGNWAGGLGLTIVQGLRVGVSAYHGPYLHRQYAYFRPGESKPTELPASAYGIDVQWARGHWAGNGELQCFRKRYHVMPTFSQHAGYAEARRVLHPRWYAAVRLGYAQSSISAAEKAYETAVGFRPNTRQLIKVGYQVLQGPKFRGSLGNTLAVQLVTTIRPISIARD
jgi:hypothetical protein